VSDGLSKEVAFGWKPEKRKGTKRSAGRVAQTEQSGSFYETLKRK
jgi:hypothetical protein